MPHHPKEENTEGNLTDKVAKESSSSNASDHPLHREDHSHASSGGKAHAFDHHSKGPVINQDIGEPASKEELRKRAEELNKK
ncbi:uncharacterized protein PV09_00103 [Verruconis gallopava]|uniref:Conidiation-specific protein 6 n=1 Tax=Verruconis gallopava TaxID=253628 RepID=A0A0D1Y295_9PEZI|nr:uncharacterized protein PV09_00103 [Verruconis gallopava]KIW09171.1 hypothetical protein PV09_00103 [Verruconis gallopava]